MSTGTIPVAKSDWNYIRACVTQVYHLIILLYINDIAKDIGLNIFCLLMIRVKTLVLEIPEVAADIFNTDLANVSAWAKTCLVTFNALHYENMPIQIYRKLHLQKLKISDKILGEAVLTSTHNVYF